MNVVIIILALWLTNGTHSVFTAVAPSPEICVAARDKMTTELLADPKVDSFSVTCAEATVPKGTKS